MDDKYYVISGSEDGDIRVYEYTLAQLLSELADYEEYVPDIITDLKDNNDPMYWGNSMLIIKGEIKKPKPKEVVKEWDI